MSDFNFTEDMIQTSNISISEEEVENERIEAAKNRRKNKDIVKDFQEEVGEDLEYEKKLKEKRAARKQIEDNSRDPLAFIVPYMDKRFVYHLFNDTPGRINNMRMRGWELVFDEKIAKLSGQNDIKGPVKIATGLSNCQEAYLMRIEKELYEEDVAMKNKINREKIAAIQSTDPALGEGSIEIKEA